MPNLISFSGLPGVGKSTIAQALSRVIPSVYLRVDAIESGLRESVLNIYPAEDAGYRAACAVAKSNLLLWHDVIADTVNPLEITRKYWSDTARDGRANLFNVEIICSDLSIHQKRVETRVGDIAGHPISTWQSVQEREYVPWDNVDLQIDSFSTAVDESVQIIIKTFNLKSSTNKF